MTTHFPADESPSAGRTPDATGRSPYNSDPVIDDVIAEDSDHAELVRRDAVARRFNQQSFAAYQNAKRRQLMISVLLFAATFLSTFLVASRFIPLTLARAYVNPEYRAKIESELQQAARQSGEAPQTLNAIMYEVSMDGLQYAVPLMLILLCHELGHFLQAVYNRVPASFPYFIPLPLPPLGTMGAVILQGRGAANRVQMFDIAVTGPLAGLIVTLPFLYFGIKTSEYVESAPGLMGLEFGEPPAD